MNNAGLIAYIYTTFVARNNGSLGDFSATESIPSLRGTWSLACACVLGLQGFHTLKIHCLAFWHVLTDASLPSSVHQKSNAMDCYAEGSWHTHNWRVCMRIQTCLYRPLEAACVYNLPCFVSSSKASCNKEIDTSFGEQTSGTEVAAELKTAVPVMTQVSLLQGQQHSLVGFWTSKCYVSGWQIIQYVKCHFSSDTTLLQDLWLSNFVARKQDAWADVHETNTKKNAAHHRMSSRCAV